MIIILIDIGGYFINGYYWLLMAITLIDISGYLLMDIVDT